MTVHLRAATRDDAANIALLVNLAGEGLPHALWARRVEYGADPMLVGMRRAARDKGVLSWRHATMAEIDGTVAGMLLTQNIGAEAIPVDSDTSPMLRPLVKLQNQVPLTRLVNVIATKPAFSRRGVARALAQRAEADKPEQGMSAIIPDKNAAALAFAKALGYVEQTNVPLMRGDWITDNDAWVLLRKP